MMPFGLRPIIFFGLMICTGIASPLWASTKASYQHYLKGLLLSHQGDRKEALQEYEAALQLDPQSSFVYEQAAQLALEMGLTDRALALAERFCQLDAKNHLAYFLLGNVRWARGEWKSSQAAFEETLRLKSDFSEALFALGNLLSSQSPEKAKKYLQDYLSANPDHSSEAHYQIALIEQRLGRTQEAISNLRSAIDLDPDHMQSRYSLAQIYELNRDTEAALGAYLDILARNPRNAALLNHIGEVYYFKGDEQKARQYFLQAKDIAQGNPTACLWLALLSEKARDFESAIRHLQESSAIDQDPAINLRLSYYLTQANRLKEAVAVLERTHQKWPAHEEITYFLALGYDDLKIPSKAIELMQEVLKVRPDHRDARFQLAMFYEKSGKIQEAELHFREILKYNPNDASALNYLGYSLADRGLKLSEAEKMLEAAVRLSPERGAYLDSLGWAHFKQGRSTQALSELQSAARLMPEDETIWDHLGEVYQVLGDTTSAWEAWKIAQSLNPQSGELSRKIARAESLLAPEELGVRFVKLLKGARGDFASFGGPCTVELKIARRGFNFMGFLYYNKNSTGTLSLDILGPLFVPVFRAALSSHQDFQMDPVSLEEIPSEVLRESLHSTLRALRDYLQGSVFRSSSMTYRRGWTKHWIETSENKLFFDKAQNRVLAIQSKEVPSIRLSFENFQMLADHWVPLGLRLQGRGFAVDLNLHSPSARFSDSVSH